MHVYQRTYILAPQIAILLGALLTGFCATAKKFKILHGHNYCSFWPSDFDKFCRLSVQYRCPMAAPAMT